MIVSIGSLCSEQTWHVRNKLLRSGTLVGNKIVGHSDVVGAAPVRAVPTTSSFST